MIKFLITIFLLISCSKKVDEAIQKTDATKTPSHRNAHAMVYHDSEKAIYLFSGASESSVKTDLWKFKSKKWSQIISTKFPKGRTFSSLVYSPVKEELILFAGNSVLFGNESNLPKLLNDTWLLKNDTWIEIKSKANPSARAEASMIYDDLNQRLVLFGGYKIENNSYIKLNDTWVFKNKQWSLLTEEGPSARHGVSMFYDNRINKVVLFGGSTIDRQYGHDAGETWQLSENKWSRIKTVFTEGIYNASLAFDEKNNYPVLFGGWDGSKRLDKTLKFQRNGWIRLRAQKSPSARNHSQMLYDKALERIILYAGHDGGDVFADMWEFKKGKWTLLSEEKPKKRVLNGH